MHRILSHLAKVKLDLSFSHWQALEGRFRVTTPPSSIVRGLSLFFWLPLLFLLASTPRLMAHSTYWLLPIGGIATILFGLGWVFFWTSYERVFDKGNRKLHSLVSILPFRQAVDFDIPSDLGSLQLTSHYATSGSVLYSVKNDGITPCHWVAYNKYPMALQFAQELAAFLECPLQNQVSQEHRTVDSLSSKAG